jgi:hypothetical protein
MHDFPFILFDKKIRYLEKLEDSYKLKTGVINSEEFGLFVIAKRQIIILSQTCDIENREFTLVAPVVEVTKATESGFVKNKQIDSIKKRLINYLFYLPAYDNLNESIAILPMIQYVPKELILLHKGNRILSLSDWGIHHLTYAINRFLCRPLENKE